MKLIHANDIKDKSTFRLHDPVRLTCASGMGMSQCMHRLAAFCKSKNNNSRVVWDTEHHEVLLWFEDEKYKTYFLLLKERVGEP
jgi:hypothetical protein